ncbi:MAG: hypothetical protein CSA05_03400 [Bacteroidia bacterium]|nr:MAG: hypothetical protein CSB01_00065 [Bacteroidia bacterium]PIE85871.1 MAG: hypothetical protein CSA05_03400 [Bacteroidia bacterium]
MKAIVKKTWRVLLIIILYLIIDFFGIIPSFGFFNKQEVSINNTPLLIKEIKEIGELISAEFYGEVYADLGQVYDRLAVQYKDSGKAVVEQQKSLYPKLAEYISAVKKVEKTQKKYKEALLKHKEGLEKYNSNPYQMQLNAQILQDATRKMDDAENKKDELRRTRNIVYIGRGCVKAGFDFKGIEETNLQIQENNNDTLVIKIPSPKIIDNDINPWFIREKKIKGYELFMERKNGYFFTDAEVRAVKLLCKTKMLESAKKKGILEKAEKSGLLAMESFFKVLGLEKFKIEVKK